MLFGSDQAGSASLFLSCKPLTLETAALRKHKRNILFLTAPFGTNPGRYSVQPMRSFLPHIKSSCMALLGKGDVTSDVMLARTEVIRKLMLLEIGDAGEKNFPAVTRRIRYAPDVQGLWYVRSELMGVLSSVHGETVAQEKIARISARFKGLIPQSLTSAAGAASKQR